MSYTEDKRRLKDLLRSFAYRKGDFTLSSGRKTEHYINCKPVILRGDGLTLVSNLFLNDIRVSSNCVAGLTLGADPLVSGVVMASNQLWNVGASRFGISGGLIIRKEPKGHGTGAWIEGKLPPEGTEITILEDVITTGGSSIKAAQKVIDAGYKVKRIVSIVDRQEGGSEAIKEAGFESINIFKLEEIV